MKLQLHSKAPEKSDRMPRKNWEEALRAAEQKYRSIFENAVEGIFQTTPDGRYLSVNPALARIYGYETPQYLIQHVTNIDSQIYVDPARRVLFKKLLKERGEVRDFEYEAYRNDGTRIWVSQSARVVRDDGGKELYYEGTTVDITRRKKAEEALQQANVVMEQRIQERTMELAGAIEELKRENRRRGRIEKELRETELRYRTVVELSPEVIVVCKHGVILFVNRAGVRFAGVEHPKELIGEPLKGIFRCRDEEAALKLAERVQKKANGDLVHAMIPTVSGNEIYVEIWSAPIFHLGEGAQLILIRDITERKEAEVRLLTYQRQLQSLASELALVQAEERRRMATSLHDNIGQTLALLKMRVQEIRAGSQNGQHRALDGVLELAEVAIQETRSLTMDLSPPILYDLGFGAAVEWLAERTSEKHSLNIRVDDYCDVPLTLDDDIKVVLFQSVREVLTNAAKHAQANTVSIALATNLGRLSVRIRDDGRGFDTSTIFQYRSNSGFGLFNIRERLRHLRGTFEIQSAPGRGTEVLIVVSLEPSEAQNAPHR